MTGTTVVNQHYCRHCQASHERSTAFYRRDRRNPDGLAYVCKVSENTRRKRRRAKNGRNDYDWGRIKSDPERYARRLERVRVAKRAAQCARDLALAERVVEEVCRYRGVPRDLLRLVPPSQRRRYKERVGGTEWTSYAEQDWTGMLVVGLIGRLTRGRLSSEKIAALLGARCQPESVAQTWREYKRRLHRNPGQPQTAMQMQCSDLEGMICASVTMAA